MDEEEIMIELEAARNWHDRSINDGEIHHRFFLRWLYCSS